MVKIYNIWKATPVHEVISNIFVTEIEICKKKKMFQKFHLIIQFHWMVNITCPTVKYQKYE